MSSEEEQGLLKSEFRRFEPSYVWNPQKVEKANRGILSLFCCGQDKKNRIYDVLDEKMKILVGIEWLRVQERSEEGHVEFIIGYKSGEERKYQKSLEESHQWMMEVLAYVSWKLVELFLELESFMLDEELNIEVENLHLKMASVELASHWIDQVNPYGLQELNIAPWGSVPLEVHDPFFNKPHFDNVSVLRVTEHCSISPKMFLSLCDTTPHFTFYSDTIQEATVRIAAKKRIPPTDPEDFVVLEWFFNKSIDPEIVMKGLVLPGGHKQEKFSGPKHIFEPAETFFVVTETEKKLSFMTVRDGYSGEFYSLIFFT